MSTRREFITLLGGAASWPLGARAQQSAMPVIGYLSGGSLRESGYVVSAFRQGLGEIGYVESQNVTVEYRWAEGQYDRLPALAADLVRRQVAVIATGGTTVSLAAKTATATIPIVFASGVDVIEAGLVTSLNRPLGNLTGVNMFSSWLHAKRLQLLQELVPTAALVAMLVNPTTRMARSEIDEAQAAADKLGQKIRILNVSNDREIDAAFSAIVEQRIGGLLVQAEPFITSRRDQLVLLTTRHAVPTIFSLPEFAAAGGLMSYGTSITASFRQIGVYAGRILKGEKVHDLPVVQPTKFELIINLKSAKALGLAVPDKLLALADEVIE
jgi:putative ABC transport system substrate-binding protein